MNAFAIFVVNEHMEYLPAEAAANRAAKVNRPSLRARIATAIDGLIRDAEWTYATSSVLPRSTTIPPGADLLPAPPSLPPTHEPPSSGGGFVCLRQVGRGVDVAKRRARRVVLAPDQVGDHRVPERVTQGPQSVLVAGDQRGRRRFGHGSPKSHREWSMVAVTIEQRRIDRRVDERADQAPQHGRHQGWHVAADHEHDVRVGRPETEREGRQRTLEGTLIVDKADVRERCRVVDADDHDDLVGHGPDGVDDVAEQRPTVDRLAEFVAPEA